MSQNANRESWGAELLPLPTKRAELSVDRAFTQSEYERLTQGFVPTQMDERWFIFMEKDTLFFYRSWTGICIYEVHLDKRHVITRVLVNRDPEQYRGTHLAYDRQVLEELIEHLLLGPGEVLSNE